MSGKLLKSLTEEIDSLKKRLGQLTEDVTRATTLKPYSEDEFGFVLKILDERIPKLVAEFKSITREFAKLEADPEMDPLLLKDLKAMFDSLKENLHWEKLTKYYLNSTNPLTYSRPSMIYTTLRETEIKIPSSAVGSITDLFRERTIKYTPKTSTTESKLKSDEQAQESSDNTFGKNP